MLDKYLMYMIYFDQVYDFIKYPVNYVWLMTKDIEANLPSAVKSQAIQDIKSILKKYTKTKNYQYQMNLYVYGIIRIII